MTVPVTLATATADTFRALLHAPFRLTLPDGQTVTGTLAEVTEQGLPRANNMRAPFSLVFHVRPDPGVSTQRPTQGTVRLEHEASGPLDVFAVPIQPLGELTRWQVVFG